MHVEFSGSKAHVKYRNVDTLLDNAVPRKGKESIRSE